MLSPLDELTAKVKLLELATANLALSRHIAVEQIRNCQRRQAERALKDTAAQLAAMSDWQWYFTVVENQPQQYAGETLPSFLRRTVRWYKAGIDRARQSAPNRQAV